MCLEGLPFCENNFHLPSFVHLGNVNFFHEQTDKWTDRKTNLAIEAPSQSSMRYIQSVDSWCFSSCQIYKQSDKFIKIKQWLTNLIEFRSLLNTNMNFK